MKKFLVILAILFGVPCGAGAAEYKTADGNFVCAKSDVDQYMKEGSNEAQFRIYFDTGSDTAHSGCESANAQIKNYLQSNTNDIREIVLIASADKQGTGSYDNRALAKRRLDYVRGNILRDNSTDADPIVASYSYVAGDADALTFSSNTNDQEERSVNIYIIWRLPNCDSVKGKKPEIVAAFQKCNISIDGNSELAKCLDGKPLTPTDDEKLLAFLFESIQKCSALKGIVGADIAAAKISKFLGSLDLTVWRDTEGNFNTARLASDSIAAVVLGTTGGIITSKLVKKNQIKKGFEDLNCSIGGQRIASYGDEFSVGLQ